MGQKKTDLRVVRTRKAIRDAFCAMIMEMDYPEITIKELTQRAMINRNTFYLHYGSIDALLRELQDEIAGEFIDKQVSYTKMCDIRRMIRVFFEYMATQSPLHDRLLCSGSYQFLYDRINQQVMGHRKLMNRGAFGMVNSTPFVRQYGILNNKWGDLLCQKGYQTNGIRQNSRSKL